MNLFNFIVDLFMAVGCFLLAIFVKALWDRRKKELPTTNLFSLLIYFFILSGLFNIFAALVLLWPRSPLLTGTTYVVVAFVWYIVFSLKRSFDYLINLPSIIALKDFSAQLQDELEELRKQNRELLEKNQILDIIVNKFQTILEQQLWVHDKNKALRELEIILQQLGQVNAVSSDQPNPESS